jgi:hypothetical protein
MVMSIKNKEVRDSGKVGENIILLLAQKQDHDAYLLDDQLEYDSSMEDGDIWIPSISTTLPSIEVKTDFKAVETKNLFFEVMSDGEFSGIKKTKSKWWVSYSPQLNMFWQLDQAGIKKLVDFHTSNYSIKFHGKEYPSKYVKVWDDKTKKYKSGYVFPIVLVELFTIRHGDLFNTDLYI